MTRIVVALIAFYQRWLSPLGPPCCRFVPTCSTYAREAFEDRLQSIARRRETLRQHARVADRRHEVGVAVPARHEMDVEMIHDAGAGRSAEIDPDVDSLRRIGLGERHLRVPRQPHQLRPLVARRRGERRHVAVRHNHQVTVVVRKQIEDDVRDTAANEDQLIAAGFVAATEDAAGIAAAARAVHVREAPRRPQAFHVRDSGLGTWDSGGFGQLRIPNPKSQIPNPDFRQPSRPAGFHRPPATEPPAPAPC